MKRLALGAPVGSNDLGWYQRALKIIEEASYEDAETVFDEYTVTGAFTETRTLDTATATTADLVALLATLITDIQKRGSKRNPNEE